MTLLQSVFIGVYKILLIVKHFDGETGPDPTQAQRYLND